mgnify:CR=1 FL=1
MSLSKRNKWILALLAIVIIGAFGVYKYTYKPHKTTEDLKADFIGNSSDFLTKISTDTDAWLNKTVELSGEITSKDDKGITLSNSIYCQFREDVNFDLLFKGQQITLKGQVIGYDDLLEELKLNQCIIQK